MKKRKSLVIVMALLVLLATPALLARADVIVEPNYGEPASSAADLHPLVWDDFLIPVLVVVLVIIAAAAAIVLIKVFCKKK